MPDKQKEQRPKTVISQDCSMPPNIRESMLRIGYVHESEIEVMTSTTPRTRARWSDLKGVMFGNEKWYPLSEVKRHLDAKANELSEAEQGMRAVL